MNDEPQKKLVRVEQWDAATNTMTKEYVINWDNKIARHKLISAMMWGFSNNHGFVMKPYGDFENYEKALTGE